MAVELSKNRELSSDRTARRGWECVAIESDGNTCRPDEISCIVHPYGRIAQVIRRGPSFRPPIGVPPAPCQLLVHSVVDTGHLSQAPGR